MKCRVQVFKDDGSKSFDSTVELHSWAPDYGWDFRPILSDPGGGCPLKGLRLHFEFALPQQVATPDIDYSTL